MKPKNLPGIDIGADERSGPTDAHLGPSNSSDSASDLAGLNVMDDDDPNDLVDVALRGDGGRSLSSAGTSVEAADVDVDRVFTPGRQQSGNKDDDEDHDLGFMDAAGEFGLPQPNVLHDDDGDVPAVGAAAKMVTKKGGSLKSNDSRAKP